MENKNNSILPPKSNDQIGKKTLVLDLDETLIHSQHSPFSSSESDIVLKLALENDPHDIHVLIRPGAKEFIKKMNKYFEIVIFTASVSKYAIPLINLIDDKGLCIHRLYREHCSLVNTSFIKDLTKLGRDLKDIIIIDNSNVAKIGMFNQVSCLPKIDVSNNLLNNDKNNKLNENVNGKKMSTFKKLLFGIIIIIILYCLISKCCCSKEEERDEEYNPRWSVSSSNYGGESYGFRNRW